MPLATIGLLSPGDMGIGIAKLLIANDYTVVTNVTDRSKATQDRAVKASLELVKTDEELCNSSDYILSIVPPRDALATAQRIIKASSTQAFSTRKNPLYFLDLNAISPRLAREINTLLTAHAPSIRHIDGGIIGGPPVLSPASSTSSPQKPSYQPRIPVSGPFRLDSASPSGAHLSSLLQIQHISPAIGPATGLKMCFASLNKGFAALAIQAYTTAAELGVSEELTSALEDFQPDVRQRAERALTMMPPKAYRWVREMEEIEETFETDGGFTGEESIFGGVARVFELVAEGSELGKEKTEGRVRGKTAGDVALLMGEATRGRRERGGG